MNILNIYMSKKNQITKIKVLMLLKKVKL